MEYSKELLLWIKENAEGISDTNACGELIQRYFDSHDPGCGWQAVELAKFLQDTVDEDELKCPTSITGMTLPSSNDLGYIPESILKFSYHWWLLFGRVVDRRTGQPSSEGYSLSKKFAIRPVLEIESTDRIGEYFIFGDLLWYIFSSTQAFCTADIGVGAYDALERPLGRITTIERKMSNWFRNARKG